MLFWRKCCSSASLRDSRYFWLLVSDGFFRRCCCPQWISRHQWSSWHQRSSWLQQRRDPWPGHWSFDSWFSHFWFLFHWTITSLSGRSTVDIPAYSHTVQYAVMHFCTNYNAIKFPSKSESESELRIIEVMDELMGLFTRKPVQTQLELLLDQYRSLTTESKKKYHNAAHDKKNPDGSPFFPVFGNDVLTESTQCFGHRFFVPRIMLALAWWMVASSIIIIIIIIVIEFCWFVYISWFGPCHSCMGMGQDQSQVCWVCCNDMIYDQWSKVYWTITAVATCGPFLEGFWAYLEECGEDDLLYFIIRFTKLLAVVRS